MSLFVAGAVLGEVQLSVFVAGAVFGDLVKFGMIAGARTVVFFYRKCSLLLLDSTITCCIIT